MFVDCSCALMSRLFDRDRDRVIERAKQSDVGIVVCWISDIEKLESLADTCRSYSGTAYFIAGIHPDNIDRTNKKLHDSWLERVEELSKRAECVGLLAGLNLSREIGTHFSQESLFRSTCGLAAKLGLPLTLHITDSASLAKAVEILVEEGRGRGAAAADEAGEDEEEELDRGQASVLHDVITACSIDAAKLRAALAAVDLYCEFSPLALTDDDENNRSLARACLQAVPRDRILLGCDSPWKTPQNLTDAHLRTLRNEPSNIPALYSAVATLLGEGLGPAVFQGNAIRVYGQWATDEIEANTTAAPAQPGPSSSLQSQQAAEGAGGAEPLQKEAAAIKEPIAVEHIGAVSRPAQAAWYVCHKCRGQLFPKSAVLSHDVANMTRSKNTAVGEGICTAAVFLAGSLLGGDAHSLGADLQQLQISEGGKGSKRSSKKASSEDRHAAAHSHVVRPVCSEARLSVGDISLSATVECPDCSCKLGRWSLADAPCPCGIMVPGPSLRITTAKVDLNEGVSAGHEELANIARIEAIRTQEDNALGGADRMGDELEKKKNKKQKKLEKAGNKGNFSNYRNKSFVPNASRAKSKQPQPAASGAAGGGPDGSSEGEGSSEEDEEVQPTSTALVVEQLEEASDEEEEKQKVVLSEAVRQRDKTKDPQPGGGGRGGKGRRREDPPEERGPESGGRRGGRGSGLVSVDPEVAGDDDT
jgi:Tat protein secretion system quality control protein TatD with DNase activity